MFFSANHILYRIVTIVVAAAAAAAATTTTTTTATTTTTSELYLEGLQFGSLQTSGDCCILRPVEDGVDLLNYYYYCYYYKQPLNFILKVCGSVPSRHRVTVAYSGRWRMAWISWASFSAAARTSRVDLRPIQTKTSVQQSRM